MVRFSCDGVRDLDRRAPSIDDIWLELSSVRSGTTFSSRLMGLCLIVTYSVSLAIFLFSASRSDGKRSMVDDLFELVLSRHTLLTSVRTLSNVCS